MKEKPAYDIVLSQESLEKIISYKNDLISKNIEPGSYLKKSLDEVIKTQASLKEISNEQFIELLLSTKRPKIFAESEIKCDGSDWNRNELEILGDINITMPVEVYDNGVWSPSDKYFSKHAIPLNAELLFTPGALLKGDNIKGNVIRGHEIKGITPDFEEIVVGNKIHQTKYNKLVERRLAPLLAHANERAKKDGASAIVTLPGIGCGAFAGQFKGKMGENLNQALHNMIERNANNYPNIACIYYDPFDECTNQEKNINGIKYRVRPTKYNPGKAQLSNPKDYQESGDDFSNLKLYKIVAWDHVSFPGNDYFTGSRNTDDGAASAATNSMEVITNINGEYKDGYYLPPSGNTNWKQVVNANNIRLITNNNVKIVTPDGSYVELKEFEKNIIKEQQLAQTSKKLTNLNIQKQDIATISKAGKIFNIVGSTTNYIKVSNKKNVLPIRDKM